MKLVIDASVALKWFFQDIDTEPGTAVALNILERYAQGELQMLAPEHFITEICAVLAREQPDTMEQNLADLLELSIPVSTGPSVLARAMTLSRDLNHHLFDTLYHAVALETDDAVLITADRRYWKKASRLGRIALLDRWHDATA